MNDSKRLSLVKSSALGKVSLTIGYAGVTVRFPTTTFSVEPVEVEDDIILP